MNPYAKSMKSGAGQKGIVLPVVLIFMVIMMMLGVAVIRNVTLDEQMAGNSRDKQLAFQAAEEALRDCEAETKRNNSVDTGKFFATQPVIEINTGKPDPKNWTIAARWNNNIYAKTVLANPELNNNPINNPSVAGLLAQRPVCMVERLLIFKTVVGDELATKAYRVTARGFGASAATSVVLQSYLKPGAL